MPFLYEKENKYTRHTMKVLLKENAMLQLAKIDSHTHDDFVMFAVGVSASDDPTHGKYIDTNTDNNNTMNSHRQKTLEEGISNHVKST